MTEVASTKVHRTSRSHAPRVCAWNRRRNILFRFGSTLWRVATSTCQCGSTHYTIISRTELLEVPSAVDSPDMSEGRFGGHPNCMPVFSQAQSESQTLNPN